MKNLFKKKFVTKKEIIDAVLTEPLLSKGSWARSYNKSIADYSSKTKSPSCTVCAVGSVLRRAMKHNTTLLDVLDSSLNIIYKPKYNTGSGRDEICKMKDDGLYLSLLSSEFEYRFFNYHLLTKRGKLMTRRNFAKWIDENFPNKVSLKSEFDL